MPGDALPMGDYLAAAVEVPRRRRVQWAPDVLEGSHRRPIRSVNRAVAQVETVPQCQVCLPVCLKCIHVPSHT